MAKQRVEGNEDLFLMCLLQKAFKGSWVKRIMCFWFFSIAWKGISKLGIKV